MSKRLDPVSITDPDNVCGSGRFRHQFLAGGLDASCIFDLSLWFIAESQYSMFTVVDFSIFFLVLFVNCEIKSKILRFE